MESWPYLILGSIAIIILGYFTFYYRAAARRAIGFANQLKQQTITELELSLATKDQLVDELKRRPLRFILMQPEFKFDDAIKTAELASVCVDACNVPSYVAVDLLYACADRMKDGRGKIVQTMDDPWCEEDK